MLDVALLTCADLLPEKKGDWYVEQVYREDAFLGCALAALGLASRRVDWADPLFDWRTTRAALWRSTWDYFHRIAEFRAFLARVRCQTRLVNPPETVLWNADKHYLADLARAGVPVVPSRFFEKGEKADLARLMREEGWREVVVKPAISGAARLTWRADAAGVLATQRELDDCLAREAMLVQPFVPGILAEGEISVVVIGGEATHAVRKTARPGDFRVQDDHGGAVHPHQASPEEREFALRASRRCGHGHDYARVDMARDEEGELKLMELELIEPELFFRFQPSAADALAKAVAARLG
jgi:glutathione synthase/RimK-type ligase-like ATP-grasp enzyme